ncbi:MAG: phosphomannomutase/phosphoglucomutase [Acidobacteria bacterium]|nr:phosphomannomutase/phosphoglucomutase [Acidobacteriota bacterium]
MNQGIFRAYDIRGEVDKDLTPEVVHQLGLGIGTYLKERGKKLLSVGRDNRLSSESFSKALIKGLIETGAEVIDLGVVTTPLFYFSLHYLDLDGGVMVTGSHNPPSFNGFKICEGKKAIYGEKIQEVRKIIEKGEFASGTGSLSSRSLIDDYIEAIKERIKIERKLRVVIDAGNGTAGLIAPRLIRELGCEVKELYCELNGRFPHHHPDPTVPEYLTDLIKTVKEGGYDLGLGFDGDADRLGVIDEKGEIVWGDKLLIIFSRDVLKRNPGAPIIFEVKCSKTLIEDIEKHGGRPVMWKTGHSLIKKKMAEINAPLAGEMSGHLFFADNYYGFDDAIFAACRLLEILSREEKTISEHLADVPKTYFTPEIRLPCPDEIKFSVVEKAKKYFDEHYQTIDVDGVRVVFPDGWGLIRPSNTQPVIVLRFEADTEKRLNEIRRMMEDKLKEFMEGHKEGR